MTPTEFVTERALRKWLFSIGVEDCAVCAERDFAFQFNDEEDEKFIFFTLNFGEVDFASPLFKEFLHEYGAHNVDYSIYTIAFLHELGHYVTYSMFSYFERQILRMAKPCIEDWASACSYWETPDEFSANVWVINFINTFSDKVNDLERIFNDALSV